MKPSARGHPITISGLEWRWAAIWAIMGVILTSLPYLIVFWATPSELFYTGFLTNPQDGHSYLAKMRQGQRGEWRFHLPYTAEPHKGVYLYSYYLALGHLARRLGFDAPDTLIWFWHAARAINGLILLLALYYTIAHWFHDIALRRFAFVLTALGSGLGWLVVLLEPLIWPLTVDLWAPEGYVWYSLFANPHFPLGMALMLLTLVWSVTPWGARRARLGQLVRVGLGAAALGVVQPLGVINLGALLAAYSLLLWVQRRRPPWQELASGAAVALTGGPFVLYAYLLSVRHPIMALWTAQNQTPSPPPWDYALSYGIVLLLAAPGIWAALRRQRDSDWLSILWAATTGMLLYMPLSLQRRFMFAWIVPLGILAARGWDTLRRRAGRGARLLRPTPVYAFAALTPLLLISISVAGALRGQPHLFLERDEKAALDWLAEQAPIDALVIAAPATGLYIPAWAGQRVIYGHDFETVRGGQRFFQVYNFYQQDDHSVLKQPPPLRAQYVWFGPREAALSEGRWQPDPDWPVVFDQGSVTIYALPQKSVISMNEPPMDSNGFGRL